MTDKLINTLEALGFDVILQGTLDSDDNIPEAFFTYWNWETPRSSYYDNKHSKIIGSYEVVAYGFDRTTVETMIQNAIVKLEEAGFIIDSEGEDIASNIKSQTGKMIEVFYEERRN